MSLKAKVEAIIYAIEEPVTLDQLASLLRDEVFAELQAEEDTRLALNEVISDGPALAENDELEDDSAFDGIPVQSASPQNVTPEVPESALLSEKDKKAEAKEELRTIKARLSAIVDELTAEY